MFLSDIVKDFIGEDIKNECKIKLDRENVLGWLKTIDGFANSEGGTFYLGVRDKTYELVGYDKKELDSEKIYLFNSLNQHFPILPTIVLKPIHFKNRDKERYILVVNIEECKNKPLILKYKEMPMIFLRRDGFTNSASMEEIVSMAKNNKGLAFDMQDTDIDFKLSDFSKLASFYKEHTNKDITEKGLASIGFFNDKGKLRRGALLFKDDYKGDDSKVACTNFAGLSRGDDLVLSSNSFTGNLIDAYSFIWEFLQQRMNHGFMKLPTNRKNFDSYPSRALFEAIINALAHRDYLIDGSQISVDMFKNRLTITSPGNIYDGKEFGPTYDLSSFVSKRRNELISQVFVYCNVMEAKGTGFEKIVEDYKDQDKYHKPYIFSKNNQFSIVLPDVTYEEGVLPSSGFINIKGDPGVPNNYASSILLFCLRERKTVNEITLNLGISNSTYFRNSVLKKLVDEGYLIPSKEGRISKYLTNKKKVSF